MEAENIVHSKIFFTPYLKDLGYSKTVTLRQNQLSKMPDRN